MLNHNGMVNGAGSSLADVTRQPSPVDTMLQELSETVREARGEVQELVNQLEPVRQIAPRPESAKNAAHEVGACRTEEGLREAIAGLRGMIEGVRATKAELRVW